ncbi:MAG TPA: hypothetical protein VNI55_01780 [Gaiellaceae bacterium]|nr:hypothetical protein [Gaiellaceae bacterium]
MIAPDVTELEQLRQAVASAALLEVGFEALVAGTQALLRESDVDLRVARGELDEAEAEEQRRRIAEARDAHLGVLA